MDYLFPSLLFIKDNIDLAIDEIYKNTKNTNLLNDFLVLICLGECHRIMVSSDNYCKKYLKLIVMERMKSYLSEYKREYKHSVNLLQFNYEEEVLKLHSLYWKLVSEILE
jgi:hypothetical protein